MRSTEALILLGVPYFLSAAPRMQTASGGDDAVLIVHSIGVKGNESTKDYIVLREMETSIGDTLDLTKLDRDKDRIYSLGLFNRVEIDYSAKGSDADLTVQVHERWYIYPFPVLGFKYRDFKKVYYGGGFVHTNFRGRNERLLVELGFGYDRWMQVSYQNPKVTNDDDISVRVGGGWWKLSNLNPDRGMYKQETYSSSLSVGKRFGLFNLFNVSVGYESWSVSDPAQGRTVSPDGNDAFMSAGAGYSFDSRDLKEYPTDGYLISVQVSKNGFGGSPVDLFRYGYDLRGYFPVGEMALAVRTHGLFSSGGAVPQYRYVYFGHGERIRGYFSSIIEGEDIMGGNLELRIPLLSPRYYEFPYSPIPEFSVWRYAMYAAVFADAGKTWFRSEGFGGRRWYSGAGAGLHFLLPYSIILRAEYAVNRHGKGEVVLDLGASF